MSSPFRRAEDFDDPINYAPPWVRDNVQFAPMDISASADLLVRSELLADSDAFSGDRAVLEMQRRLALDPDSIPEPPPSFSNGATIGRVALRIFSASGAAALIAWALVSAPGARLLGQLLGQQFTAATSLAAPTFSATNAQEPAASAPVRRPDRSRPKLLGQRSAYEPPERSFLAMPTIVAVAEAAERVPEVAPPVPVPSSQPAAAAAVTRQLDGEEIKSLLARGDALIASGDLASARLVLRRAAEAGNARAAFVLGSTYDPNVWHGSQGFAADAALARLWYERARQFGSADAPLRLQQLAADVNARH